MRICSETLENLYSKEYLVLTAKISLSYLKNDVISSGGQPESPAQNVCTRWPGSEPWQSALFIQNAAFATKYFLCCPKFCLVLWPCVHVCTCCLWGPTFQCTFCRWVRDSYVQRNYPVQSRVITCSLLACISFSFHYTLFLFYQPFMSLLSTRAVFKIDI